MARTSTWLSMRRVGLARAPKNVTSTLADYLEQHQEAAE
jgi:hypothetical protein